MRSPFINDGIEAACTAPVKREVRIDSQAKSINGGEEPINAARAAKTPRRALVSLATPGNVLRQSSAGNPQRRPLSTARQGGTNIFLRHPYH
jgi:hypothetical protein